MSGISSQFSIRECRGTTLLCNRAWWDQGLLHGMTTTELSFSQVSRELCAQRLCESFGADRLVLLKQVHGKAVLDLRDCLRVEDTAQFSYFSYAGEADAVVVPCRQPVKGRRFLFGVLTADCVPIILRSGSGLALIHAGWRGLAQGIIEATSQIVRDVEEGAVFACAGGDSYEVGEEVVAQIGSSAVVTRTSEPGKVFLDTGRTALRQLKGAIPHGSFVNAEICSISDLRFHSFRRDGDRAGRGVTFVCPPDA